MKLTPEKLAELRTMAKGYAPTKGHNRCPCCAEIPEYGGCDFHEVWGVVSLLIDELERLQGRMTHSRAEVYKRRLKETQAENRRLITAAGAAVQEARHHRIPQALSEKLDELESASTQERAN